jgi:hypothetical protein
VSQARPPLVTLLQNVAAISIGRTDTALASYFRNSCPPIFAGAPRGSAIYADGRIYFAARRVVISWQIIGSAIMSIGHENHCTINTSKVSSSTLVTIYASASVQA